jgi:hypothetical protein
MPQYQRSESVEYRGDGYIRRPGAPLRTHSITPSAVVSRLRRDVETECFRGFGVDDALELHRRPDRKLTGRIALQDAIDVV